MKEDGGTSEKVVVGRDGSHGSRLVGDEESSWNAGVCRRGHAACGSSVNTGRLNGVAEFKLVVIDADAGTEKFRGGGREDCLQKRGRDVHPL